MRGLTTFLTCGVFAAAATIAAPDRAQAVGGGPRIDATAEALWRFDSWLEVYGGVIDHGFLRGGLNGVFDVVGQDGGNLVFGGTMAITTRHGDLYLSVADLQADGFNILAGEVSAHATVTGGTGMLDGATGELYLHGNGDDFGVLDFDEISGTIVLDVP